MADRFPLILNTSTNQIQEIASGDQLDLSGNNIANAGIITATTFVGAVTGNATGLTGNPSISITDIDVDGHTNLDNVSVAGITTINGGTLTVSGNFPRFYFIDTAGSDLDAYIVNNDNLLAFGKTNSPTPSNDVLTLNLSSYLSTFKGNVAITKDLDVDGHTNLDNLSVAGVSTFAGNADFSAGIDVTGAITSTGDITISSTSPQIFLTDTDNRNYEIGNNGGTFRIRDLTSDVNRISINSSGDVDISGNLSVGGVLTYEDVTNVDSVGIVTARQGVRLGVDGTSSANYISVGAGNDLKIWHQSSNNHSYISETGSGSLIVLADDFYVQDTSTATMISAKEGAEVNLHFNGGSPKLSTTNTGVTITGTASATTFVGALTGTASGNATISANADNRIITGGSGNALSGEANLTWDGTKLEVKTAFGGGGGTGLVLNDSVSTGANEGMNIQWQSGTDKQSDQCRIGQFSNATGSGSNLDFYTNAGDSGSSTRRLRITHDGKLGINQLDIDADLHVATAGSSEQDGTLKVGGSENSLGLVLAYDQSGYTTSTITSNPTYSSSGSILKIRTNAGDNPNQLVLKAGYVGISTDDPQRRLNIVHRSSSAYSATGFSGSGPTSLRLHNPEGTDNQGVGYHSGLEFVVSRGANSYGQLGYVRSGNNIGDFYFKHRTGGSSYAETTRIRHNGHLVNRGPMYGIWNETVQTANGGSRDTQFIQDSFGTWIIVAKIQNIAALRANQASTATLDTTNNDFADGGKWSSNWGDSYPVAVRYISASDWNFWRETRVIDFIHGVPHGRQYKAFFTDGQSSGMNQNTKWGWTCDGAWDGFGRWHNPTFAFWRMSDGNPTTVSQAFFTSAGGSCDFDSADDAKFGAHHSLSYGGQDTNVTTVYGVDDGAVGREDNFPNAPTNNSGTDFADYGLWVCINLGTLGQFH